MAGITIGSNVGSLNVRRQLDTASARLGASYEKLSSGLRINKASDDAAGLAISSSLNSHVRILNQAVRNINDGISMANIGEGALGELKNISMRQRELATQAANGSYTTAQRQAMNIEANKLVDEYNRIVDSTAFNGTAIFSNNGQGVRLQAGTGTDGSLLLGIGNELARNAGDGTFQAAQEFLAGDTAWDVAVADFNKDGKADLVTADYIGDSASVLLGNGNGTFQSKRSFTAGTSPTSVTVADFNGDGNSDFVTADYGTNTVSVFLGHGDGTFDAKRVSTADLNPYQVKAGDLNGDGRTDLITANYDSHSISILLGKGDGTFQARNDFTTDYPYAVALDDFNADGKTDLIATNYDEWTMSVFLSNGDGSFQVRQIVSVQAPLTVAVADFNGDGKSDFAEAGAGDNSIGVYLGNGDDTFQARRSCASSLGSTQAIISGDFNSDGRSDLALSNWDTGTVGIYMGNGDGTFAAKRDLTAVSASSVALGDFNGDGRTDLVTTSSAGSAADVFLANGNRVARTAYLNLCTRQGALDAMAVIDGNLLRIQNELGTIGATTSRFSVALETLQASKENEAAASSRITDADVALESAEMIKNQVIQQAASAVLSTVNRAPEIALQLLRNG